MNFRRRICQQNKEEQNNARKQIIIIEIMPTCHQNEADGEYLDDAAHDSCSPDVCAAGLK